MQLSNAKAIVLHQNTEWSRVMGEETERQSLLRYGITLIVISYVLLFLLSLLFSMAISVIAPYSSLHIVANVIVDFALAVATLYFVPQILAALAPNFGGQNDSLNALKLYVFAATPMWLGMSIVAIPVIGWLAAIAGAFYGIYLFWQHFAQAMSIPEDRKIGYVLVAILVIAVIELIIGAIGAGIANAVSPVYLYHGPL